jgi:hypothetical protein
LNVETSTGALPGLQARGRDAAMQTETPTSADRPTSAAREGLTAPDVLFLALAALLALIGLGLMISADRPTRRRGEGLSVAWPPEVDAVGNRVEDAAREGLTAPDVLFLALAALLALIGLGSMMLVLAII